MYDSHYTYIKYDHEPKLLFTDTDILIYETEGNCTKIFIKIEKSLISAIIMEIQVFMTKQPQKYLIKWKSKLGVFQLLSLMD